MHTSSQSSVVVARLAAVLLCVAGLTGAASADPVLFQNTSATYGQTFTGNFFASTMFDGVNDSSHNGWAIYDNGATVNQTAAMETVTDLTAASIQVDMYQLYGTGHTIGRFRFSVTTDDRSTFADGLQTGGDVTANWTVLNLSSATLPAGVTYSVLGDGSLLIGGANPATALYSLTFNLPFGGITGLRLEALEDASLLNNGPGRRDNGNFVISEMVVTSTVPAPSTAAGLLGFTALAATRRRRV